MTRRPLAEWTLFGGAAAGPAVIALPLNDQFALPKLALALAMSGALLALLDPHFTLRRWMSHPAAVASAAVLLAWLVIATAFADHPRQSILGTYADYSGLLYYVPAVVAFLAAVALIRGVAALERLVSLLAIGAIPVLAYAVVQFAGADPVSWDIDFGRRVFSTLGQPLVLGGYLATLLPLLLWLAMRRRGGERAFLLGEAAVGVAVLLASGTRGAWIGFAVAVVVGLALLARSRGVSRRAIAALAAAAVGTLSIVAILAAAGAIPDRLRSATTLAERTDLWRGSIEMAADRPLTGWGPDQFAYAYGPYRPSAERGAQSPYESPAASPHNETLTVLLAGGAPALLAYAALWLAVATAAVRARPRGNRGVGTVALLAALAGYLAQAQFSIPDPSLAVIAMTLLGALAGLAPARRGVVRSQAVPARVVWAPRVVGAALAAAAVVLIAADYASTQSGDALAASDPAALRKANRARTLNPLQARYDDDVAVAHDASVRWGVSAPEAGALAVIAYDGRITRFGAGASTYLDAARIASRERSSLPIMERYLDAALAADPLNPGTAAVIDEIRRGAVR